jgi:hypothetical protein
MCGIRSREPCAAVSPTHAEILAAASDPQMNPGALSEATNLSPFGAEK